MQDDSASSMLGYALIVALVALATTLAIGQVGGQFVHMVRSATPPPTVASTARPGLDVRDP